MPRTIIINSSNIVPNSGNSTFVYKFPQSVKFENDYIAVQQVSLYNSVFNITTLNNNYSFSYIWIDGTVVNIVIPNSYLSLDGINQYLQFVMIQNKHYMLNSSGQYIYFLELVVNQSRYAYQINNYLLSVALATTNSWTLPVGATWVIPTNAILPYLIVPNTNFQTLIGFAPGQYPNGTITGVPPGQIQTPAYTTAQSELSSTAPQITPQPTYVGLCSLVNAISVIPSQLIYSMTPVNVGFGELYVNQINDLAFNKIENGTYAQFSFRFTDTNGNPIIFQDNNIMILLVIKNKDDVI